MITIEILILSLAPKLKIRSALPPHIEFLSNDLKQCPTWVYSRLSHLKSYFKKEILLLLVVNLVFGYCISGTVNLWRGQVLHDNLALFWSLLIASYFTFDVLICFKFLSKPNAVQVGIWPIVLFSRLFKTDGIWLTGVLLEVIYRCENITNSNFHS